MDEDEDEYAELFNKPKSAVTDENLVVFASVFAGAVVCNSKKRKKRNGNEERVSNWWYQGYVNWNEKQFKKHFRITRYSFNHVLNIVSPFIKKTPTNLCPNPTTPATQLGLTLYRLAHGTSHLTNGALFGVSEELACVTFNNVCKDLVTHMYDEYVKLPDDWEVELRGFLENYEFPCVGVWDGFHVYIESKLKSYFSFKKRYSMSNMGLVSYNKRFLYAAVGAPGSTHDARMLRNTSLFKEIVDGNKLPKKSFNLEDIGEIPLLTIGNSAFPRFPWLIKAYTESPRMTQQQKYFNRKLCSARVVVENCYGMLKGRWRVLYKKTECRLDNLKYVIMCCIMLHNFCISTNDPCKPRWILAVEELSLHEKETERSENKQQSDLVRMNVSNWLWSRKE